MENITYFIQSQNCPIFSGIFIPVITGLVVIVIGNFILKMIIEPLDNAFKQISKTKNALGFYARQISEPSLMKKEDIEEASDTLRKLSFDIFYIPNNVRLFSFFSRIKILPSKKNLEEAHQELMGLSNSLYDKSEAQENRRRRAKIDKLLLI